MKKETIKNTTNSRVYRLMYIEELLKNSGFCRFCGPHSGCNSFNKYHNDKSWKKHRKLQYKEKNNFVE